MDINFKKLYSVFTILSYFITIFFSITYIYTDNLAMLLFTLLSFFISSIMLCFTNIKYYILHLFFYITIFVFLVSRPTIDYFKENTFFTYQRDAYEFAFIIVIISILGLTLGGFISKLFIIKNKEKKFNINKEYQKNIRIVSFVVYWITFPFYAIRLIERLLFRMNTDYYTYYATFNSKLPYFTYILSTFMIYSMCIYLASRPKKILATVVLVSNVFVNAIYLFIGTRNPFILSLIFAFIYYFIRNQEGLKKLWIGFKEKFLIVISVPILMFGMGALNYIRDDVSISDFKIFGLILDFVYKQGTSFGVLARGYLFFKDLPIREFTSYTFGGLIEYFTKGNLGQILFDTKPFVNSTNSVELALHSNSYPHNISYVVLNEKYLDGHGIGGSYIMELFSDYGYIGVFIGSVIFGMLFIYMLKSSYENRYLIFTCSLMILTNLFFLARSTFTETFLSLFTMQFWTIIILIIFVSKMITKKNSFTTYKEDE